MSNIDPDSPPFGDGAANFGATETPAESGAHTASLGAYSSSSSDSPSSSATDTAKEAAGTAKEQAGAVADDAKQAASDVLSAGKDEAANVVQEAKVQVKDLLDQSRSQLTEQAHSQKENAAKGARAFSDDLTALANGEGGQDNMAANLVSQAASRAQGVAQWLENRDPSQLLDDVRSFARRRPGAFILIAAATGLVGGRLIRALTAEAKDEKEAATGRTDGPEYDAPAADSLAYDAPAASAYGTVGSRSLERDYAPTEPVADPLDGGFPNGGRL
ncbi:hypothetical protein C5C18_12660 [Rathayibacter tritici]|uniref:ATP synthase F0 subunit B n=1 Tax=Rathayibacter tritici TaxID=33888 RepID=A0A169C6J8_9MICO|nr:hypothetical protein [Rathayibacter tritici]AND17781.1 hypothetical protein A6122_2668 [Rathayibacter tritici]PPF26982.1 hypothetical protein C5C06_10520 [Rathayibacter tritici]PPF65811.1 hypothetical protein C5C21_10565 [Rathayibacter tritici]PPG05374.1 hypothetical protein C5C18_12660 [Rathayibacter tritici]PPI19194.1 hypothetical protein C5D07_02375 [Rathayibacter tritici]